MWFKKIIGFGLLGLLAGLLLTQFFFAVSSASKLKTKTCFALDPQPMGISAPPFTLRNLKGETISLEDQKEKIVLLHFWATWCPPCVEELPSLAALHKASKGTGFLVMTVSVDESEEILTNFLKTNGLLELPVLKDPQRKTASTYGTMKFPESYLIDRNGIIQYRFINKRNWASDLARDCIDSLK